LFIYLDLPYWEDLKINHVVDPMNIFKNVAMMVWDHLMGVGDSLGIRMDFQCYKKMPSTWPVERQVILPRAPWTLTRLEMRDVKEMITMVRTLYLMFERGILQTKAKRGGAASGFEVP
jgi:hypothetical protein